MKEVGSPKKHLLIHNTFWGLISPLKLWKVSRRDTAIQKSSKTLKTKISVSISLPRKGVHVSPRSGIFKIIINNHKSWKRYESKRFQLTLVFKSEKVICASISKYEEESGAVEPEMRKHSTGSDYVIELNELWLSEE